MTKEELLKIIEQEGDNKKFEYKGFNCEIKRIGELGHLCGYVDIPKEHELYNLDNYNDIEFKDHPHGGLTYGERSGEVYRIGFDCAHWRDLTPRMFIRFDFISEGEIYRTMDFVEEEIKKNGRSNC